MDEDAGAISTEFWNKALAQLKDVQLRNQQVIPLAAAVIAKGLLSQGRLLAFGCGHSGLVCQDIYYRAGGLRDVECLFDAGISLDYEPVAETSQREKASGWARELVDNEHLGKQDTLIVVSTSGVNAAPVEAAMAAKSAGAKVIVVSSSNYFELPPRHESGQRLADLADFFLDNASPYGDCLITNSSQLSMGSASTAAGALLLQSLMIEVFEASKASGGELKTYVSGNLPGGMEQNAS